ncbi:hypothetical protein I8752_29280 [Nostocaceae cyanobacterium CENA369]|uniref:Uncharacterized protein n=1 Tax=Dendronalium phyllosphericum CENA369 TaxID=1725256 RepID=A0A8J7LIG5_9NOST|nr:hypothetical protein [Dendronalium phyllosphericum]MBH8577003.1 hypothetical protein [Dendronalium phyllosphericum CENA369]
MTIGSNQAFPIAWNQYEQLTQDGLTKREFFAAMALQGFLANANNTTYELQVTRAVKAADALIAALSKPEYSETKQDS